MKNKIILAIAVLGLGACSLLEQSGASNASQLTTTGKLKACSIDEATKMVQNGRAFSQGVSASADEISSNCIKRLALQSAGLDNQATQDATNALTTLMNAAKR